MGAKNVGSGMLVEKFSFESMRRVICPSCPRRIRPWLWILWFSTASSNCPRGEALRECAGGRGRWRCPQCSGSMDGRDRRLWCLMTVGDRFLQVHDYWRIAQKGTMGTERPTSTEPYQDAATARLVGERPLVASASALEVVASVDAKEHTTVTAACDTVMPRCCVDAVIGDGQYSNKHWPRRRQQSRIPQTSPSPPQHDPARLPIPATKGAARRRRLHA
jgi:hypothetical protein